MLPPQFGNSYGPENLFRTQDGFAWVEGRPGQGIGEWITVEFDALRTINSVVLRTGYQKNADIFAKNGRVRQLRMMFSDSETMILNPPDRPGAEILQAREAGEGLLDQVHDRRRLPGREVHGHGNLEASGQFGTGAVMRLRLRGKAAGVAIVVAALAFGCSARSSAQSPKDPLPVLPKDFVYLRDVDPTIIQDIRYAGANNFTGRRLGGYEAGECIVKRDVATALGRVQQDLKPRGLSLKVFDCYRPRRASRDMLAWANGAAATPALRRYYPQLNKRDLFKLGYIAASSGHSTGAAVDLTLVDLAADNRADFDPDAAYADCTAPAEKRAPEGSVDMGTGYDCFDAASHTAAVSITPQQRRWRQTLIAAMGRHGLANYCEGVVALFDAGRRPRRVRFSDRSAGSAQ